MHQNQLEDLLKQIWRGPTSRISDSEGVGKDLETCISKKFSVEADATGLETHFENCWTRTFCYSSCPSG